MLKEIRIGTRLAIGFGLILFILLVVGGTGYWGIRVSTRNTINMLEGDAKIAEHAAQARANVGGMRRYEKEAFLNVKSQEKMTDYVKKWKEQHEQLAEQLSALGKVVTSEKDRATVESMKTQLSEYDYGFTTVMSKILEGEVRDADTADAAIAEFNVEIQRMEEIFRSFAEESNKRMKSQEEVMAMLAKKTTAILLFCILFAVAASVLIAVFITRSIIKPLGGAIDVANRLSAGDLTVQVEADSKDEVGQLLVAFNGMVDNLRRMILRIREASAQVASAAIDISASSDQLAKSAQVQSAAAEETSSTMAEMAASIQNVAGNANDLAKNVEEVSSSIMEMGASSEEMAKTSEVMAASVMETSATIEQMATSIEQVAANARELQEAVGKTSTIVAEMAVSIKKVAKNVEEADQVAKTASEEGSAGQKAVQEALASMKRVADVMEKTAESIVNLGKRSEEIGTIVNVINEIADQTNLLALNAAIEAARAGDAGKGFAVVADEVRRLAERSMVATGEIAEVIKQVQADTTLSIKYGEQASKEAKNSMELSEVARGALRNIVMGIEHTSNLMSDIAAMASDQASASNQVIKAVERMNDSAEVVAKAAREQAVGGRQIRVSVERMNQITANVATAAREQAIGSRQIRNAVENMNDLTRQVNAATREQAVSARHIVSAVNSMNTMTQAVASSTSEQKKGGELIVTAVDNISCSSRENRASVDKLSNAAQDLSVQAEALAALVAEFKVK